MRSDLTFRTAAPVVHLRVPLNGAQRKEEYSVRLELQNTAPIPIIFKMSWDEDAPGDVREVSDSLDALDGAPADRSAAMVDVFAPFYRSPGDLAVATVGAFRRTWNWIEPPPDGVHPVIEYLEAVKKTATEVGGVLNKVAERVTKPINKARSEMFRSIGLLQSTIEGLGFLDSVINAMPINSLEKSIRYDARILGPDPVSTQRAGRNDYTRSTGQKHKRAISVLDNISIPEDLRSLAGEGVRTKKRTRKSY